MLIQATSIDVVKDLEVTISSVLKDRSLKGRFRDAKYPAGHMPFYLYGTKHEANIDHVLVQSPNIQLSADNIKLDFDVPEELLTKGALLSVSGIEEASMQPFESTEGASKKDFERDSDFFFRPGQKFAVKVFEDTNKVDATGPGLVDCDDAKVVAEGNMTLGEGLYVDSHWLNKDPFERIEGDEKFKQWKKVFERIEQEMQ